jgi:hypothetical protein
MSVGITYPVPSSAEAMNDNSSSIVYRPSSITAAYGGKGLTAVIRPHSGR